MEIGAVTTLREISIQTSSDKARHHFESHYEAHLAPLRDQSISLLEIGVKGGGSLLAWERYFPKARIFGIDINPKCLDRSSARSTVFIGDQADVPFLESVAHRIAAPLDVVIDDGGHNMDQQRVGFETLFKHLKPGGWYIVEDIHTSYKSRHGGGPRGFPGTFVEFLKGLIDDVHFKESQAGPERFRISSLHVYRRICFVRKMDLAPAGPGPAA